MTSGEPHKLPRDRFTGGLSGPAIRPIAVRMVYECRQAVTIPVIASGGAGSLDHMVHVLNEGKADAVLAASIFHYGEYTVQQAKQLMATRGIEVRL